MYISEEVDLFVEDSLSVLTEERKIKMKLQNMTKEEILEALDVLSQCSLIDPEGIYVDRQGIIEGADGDNLWKLCKKYRQPLIDYVYRDLKKEI